MLGLSGMGARLYSGSVGGSKQKAKENGGRVVDGVLATARQQGCRKILARSLAMLLPFPRNRFPMALVLAIGSKRCAGAIVPRRSVPDVAGVVGAPPRAHVLRSGLGLGLAAQASTAGAIVPRRSAPDVAGVVGAPPRAHMLRSGLGLGLAAQASTAGAVVPRRSAPDVAGVVGAPPRVHVLRSGLGLGLAAQAGTAGAVVPRQPFAIKKRPPEPQPAQQ